MLSLTHASAGALAGEFIPNPVLAFLAGIIIHLVMDKIPHYWPERGSDKGIVIVADVILSSLFIAGLFLFPTTRIPSVIAGACGGVSVDVYFVLIMRSKGKLAEWHTNRQPHRKRLYWLLSDIVIFTILVVLIGIVGK